MGYSSLYSDTLFWVGYNLVIILVIVKIFLRRFCFCGCRQKVSNHIKFLCLLLFFRQSCNHSCDSENILCVFSRSFVGVSNFICESVDYPTVVLELWPEECKGSRWGRRHHEGTNMLAQSGDARCTRGDTWCCENKNIKVIFAIWIDKS